jgi:hypothetical protein
MPQDPSSWLAFGFGAIVGSLIVGSLLGLIPFVLGESLTQAKFGRIGFFCTLGASLVGGAVLALPTALGFVVVVIVRWRRAKALNASDTTNAA